MTVANPLDVPARLAEGRRTVDDVEQYVAACQRLGYRHRDLTTHSTQVRDWYLGEDGLDLRALNFDHGVLAAAASTAEDAARMQADLMAGLDAAWSGKGAAAAGEFLSRSCQSANAVGAAVRAVVDAVATLRDALWRAVDAKALATEVIDATQQPHRAAWLPAAATVSTGGGDAAAASELVDQQVRPFVELDVGADWVAAMRDATSSIDAAYDAAIAHASPPVVVFGVPGVLGPRGGPPTAGGRVVENAAPLAPSPSSAPVQTVPTPLQTVPAAAVGSAPASVAPAAPSSAADPAASTPMAAPAMPPGQGPMPSTGELGAGTSSMGSGLSGFGQQLADLIGGLFGSTGDSSDPAGLDDELGLGEHPDESDGDLNDGDTTDGDTTDGEAGDEEPKEEDELTALAEPEQPEDPAPGPPAEPEPSPTPAPMPLDPPPAVEGLPDAMAQPLPQDGEPTPCEIAADELPQVGE